VLTEIDVKDTLKKNWMWTSAITAFWELVIRRLRIKHYKQNHTIGLMLPCNLVVQEAENGKTLVSAIDPIASMQAVENESLGKVAEQVRAKLQKVIESV